MTYYVWGFYATEKDEDDYDDLPPTTEEMVKRMKHIIAKDSKDAMERIREFLVEDNGEDHYQFDVYCLIRKMKLDFHPEEVKES